jgi:hypothetical protein
MTVGAMAHDVFISYATADLESAQAACASLESAGVRCWMAPRDIVPGMNFGEAVSDAIEHARLVVLVLSSHANASSFVALEVELAVSQRRPIIPLRIEPVTPSKKLILFISAAHWLNANRPPTTGDLDQLVAAVNAHAPDKKRVKKSQKGQTSEKLYGYTSDSKEHIYYWKGRTDSKHKRPKRGGLEATHGPSIAVAYERGYDDGLEYHRDRKP